MNDDFIPLLRWEATAQRCAVFLPAGRQVRSFEKQIARLLPTFLLTINMLNQKVGRRKNVRLHTTAICLGVESVTSTSGCAAP